MIYKVVKKVLSLQIGNIQSEVVHKQLFFYPTKRNIKDIRRLTTLFSDIEKLDYNSWSKTNE